MKHSIALAALLVVGVGSIASAQNLLVDPGFENPITFDGPPFVGFWEGFAGGGATAGNSSVSPRTGAMHADATINATPNTFAGVFQDVAVLPGATYTFSGYHATPTSVLGTATEVRIEWRDATTEVGRTPNLMVLPTGPAYTEFVLTANAPLNATFGRFVYAIQTFGSEPNPGDNGTVYLDDMSVVLVPEPTTLALFAGAMGLVRRNRR
jgi:hypothetical protein